MYASSGSTRRPATRHLVLLSRLIKAHPTNKCMAQQPAAVRLLNNTTAGSNCLHDQAHKQSHAARASRHSHNHSVAAAAAAAPGRRLCGTHHTHGQCCCDKCKRCTSFGYTLRTPKALLAAPVQPHTQLLHSTVANGACTRSKTRGMGEHFLNATSLNTVNQVCFL
jgi:hypothetical protein